MILSGTHYNNYLRLVTFGCHVIWKMKTTTCPKEGKCQSSGQLQRLLPTKNTQQPVMCGAMAVSSMRYGVSDTNLLKARPTVGSRGSTHVPEAGHCLHTNNLSLYHHSLTLIVCWCKIYTLRALLEQSTYYFCPNCSGTSTSSHHFCFNRPTIHGFLQWKPWN